MATQLLKSQYDGWYTTLNQIRTKHGRPVIPTATVTKNGSALSSQMSTLQASVTNVKNNTDYHLKNASINTTIPNINKNQSILLSTKTSIDSMLSAMLAVCHYYSDESDESPDDSHCSTDRSDNSSDNPSHRSSDNSQRGSNETFHDSDCQRGDDSGYGRNASY